MRRLAGVLLVLCLITPARADLPAKARGSAPVTGGDTAAARTRALDDAVRQAVDQTLAATLDPKVREASAEVLKKRILRRARAYVRELRVTGEGEGEGVYAVAIDATINDALLAADLRALGVGVPPPIGTPVPDEPAAAPPPRARPALALLVVGRHGDEVEATFGLHPGDGGPAGVALARELAARGMKTVRPAAADVPLAPGGEGSDLPLDVGQAAALTRAAGAGGAVVAAAELRDAGRIRGTAQVGAECHLAVRLDDVTSGRLAEARADGAGFGPDVRAAVAQAARDAATRAGRDLGRRLESHWPEDTAVAGARGTLVHVRGALRYGEVDAVARALGAVPGVTQVTLVRFGRREVTLLVVGGAAARALAEAAGLIAFPDLKVAARAAGGEVAVDLAPDATRPAPPTPAPGTEDR